MEGQGNREIGFEHYEGPDAPPVDHRRTQYQVPANTVPRPYKCQECPRSFDRPSLLAQHMLAHSGERPHLCTFCNVKRFATTSNLYRHMRGCPRNPNKGKARESRSQVGGEAPPLLAANTAEPPDAFHTWSPYVASDVPHYSSPGSHVMVEHQYAINNQLVPAPALALGSAPRKTLISSLQGTATSNSNEEILRTDLQPSAVVWEGVPSPSAQGHVDSTSFPFIDNDTSSSHRHQAPVQPTMQQRGYQDVSMAQTSEGSHFYRDPDHLSSEEATAPSSADVTTPMQIAQASRFVYPLTMEVARDALQGDLLPANVMLAGAVQQPAQLPRPTSLSMRPREAGGSLAGLENPMATAEFPFSISPIAPTSSFPEELRPHHHDTQDDGPTSPRI